jgi:hypothetical protein
MAIGTLNFSISFVALFLVVVFIRTFYIFFSQEFRPPFSVWVICTHFRLSFVAFIPTFTKINYPWLDKNVGFWLVNDPCVQIPCTWLVALFLVVVFIRTFYIFFSQEFRPPFSVWDAKCFDIMSLTCIAT